MERKDVIKMDTVIKVKCIDQALTLINSPVIASGGLNENKLECDFCEKWDGFSKTAVFYQDKKNVYYSVLDENDTCIIPKEATASKGTMCFGIFGSKGDVTRTSEVLRYKIDEGAITEDLKPSDPTPDIYEQILAKLQEIREAEATFETKITKQQSDFETGLNGQMTTFRTEVDGKIANKLDATANAVSASKLQTARRISLGTGVSGTATFFDGSSDITIPVIGIKEAYLSWGGENIAGNLSPMGVALSQEHSANKLAFINGGAITVEYSTDGGETWNNFGYSDDDKSKLFTTSYTIPVGRKKMSEEASVDSRTRITIDAKKDGITQVYAYARKLLVYMSTASDSTMQLLIEYTKGETEWTTVGTYEVKGWSGWNEIPVNFIFGGFEFQTKSNWHLRLTFINTKLVDEYKTVPQVLSIRLFGDNAWVYPSEKNNKGELSKTGHLYSYDIGANATFPANVTASSFIGNLTGTATKATSDGNGNNIANTYATKDYVDSQITAVINASY